MPRLPGFLPTQLPVFTCEMPFLLCRHASRVSLPALKKTSKVVSSPDFECLLTQVQDAVERLSACLGPPGFWGDT